ncbi:MAG: simple sugar transport system permease protein [Thermomicrobiales bacterium]|nr:simple sugar transport system permease protein [Thermomicrobiales bacterium]
MAVTSKAAGPGNVTVDERVARVGSLRRLLVRPEMGAVSGAILVWAFFAIVAGDRGFLSLNGTANYLVVSAELGILAVAVALLMIGGEFDLSIGSVLGACGMIVAVLSAQHGWNIWAAIAASLCFALLIGFINGVFVHRTGLPSFIVTLGMLFVIRGATIGLTRRETGRTQVGGLAKVDGYDAAHKVFASHVEIGGASFSVAILWWLGIAALATWILLRTAFGNWITGVGGSAQAARNVGVPVARVRILLFMGTAVSAWLVSVIQAVTFTGSDVLRGQFREFYAIVAVVIGGTLLTGGYGTAIGAVLGALIYGMVQQGIVFAGVDADWFQVFLGAMLLAAVLINRFVRNRAVGGVR